MKTLLKLFAFASVIILIAIGCQKVLSDQNSQGLNVNANKEFNTAFVKEWYYGVFKKSEGWNKSPIHGEKIPDWKNSSYHKIGKMEIVEFPLVKKNPQMPIPSGNTLTSAEKQKLANASLSKILFIKNAKGDISVREIDYIPDWQYLQNKQFDISKVSYGKAGDDFTGKMIIKKWDGKVLSLNLVTKGKITQTGEVKKTGTKSKTDANNTSNVGECNTVTYCWWEQECNWTMVGDSYEKVCGEWYNTWDCWDETYCNNEDPCGNMTEEQCACMLYGSCGGGEECISGCDEEPPAVIITSVTNELIQPCQQNAFAAISSNKMKNELTKLYEQTFVGNNKVHNLTIGESSTIPNGWPGRSTVDPQSPDTWIIDLNNGYEHQFTQELWGSIILHEMVHGFIRKNELGFTPSSSFSSLHQIMLDKWICQISAALKEVFGLTDTNALALSLEGFDDILKDDVSSQFRVDMKVWIQTKYSVDLAQMSQIADDYYTKVKGTPCQ